MVQVKVKRKDKIPQTIAGINRGSELGLESTVIALRAQVKLYAPVDKGILRASIFSKIKRFFGHSIGFVKTNTTYAIYNEDGTKNMKAANGGRGFFKPAVAYMKTRMAAIFSAAIRKEIRRKV